MDKKTRDHDTMLQGLYWWGIPTLFRCPYNPDPEGCDIALVGVPHSTGNGTTERDQHLGPRAVRNVSALGRRAHLKFGISPWEQCDIRDLGDVPLPEANNNEKCIEHITEFYTPIAEAQARPLSIGGDHSITGGILQALAAPGSKLTGGEKAVLLHFDAHTDAFHQLDHFLGAVKSAAHWASYLVRDGFVDASKSVQIGIRGNPRTLDWLDSSHELGYEVITKDQYDEYGPERCVEIIRERVGDAPLYLTFDLDCLDVTVAPGVANLEPAIEGFKMPDVLKLLQGMRGKNIIGGDVVCLMPTRDAPNQITSLVANAVLFEMLCLIADNLRTA
jgi:guanidinopropionase